MANAGPIGGGSRNGGRRHWREKEARAWVDAWLKSGQTEAEFARAHGIQARRLARWARRLTDPVDAAGVREPVRFHPVRVGPARRSQAVSEERIELELGGGRSIKLPRGFDPADLRHVLAALEASAEC